MMNTRSKLILAGATFIVITHSVQKPTELYSAVVLAISHVMEQTH